MSDNPVLTDTPISDEAAYKGEYGDDYSPDVVSIDVCRKMERENQMLKEALMRISAGHKRPNHIAAAALARLN